MIRKANIKQVKDLIFKGARLHSMAKTSEVFSRIDHAVISVLPSMLADNCEVRSYNDNILTLNTHSSAVATQLRFNAPSITSRLKKNLLFKDIIQIDIKVATKSKVTPQPKPRIQYNRPQVSTPTCKLLENTADNVDSTPLAESLRHLAHTLKDLGKD